jgi:putative spermidine/putrescine transport system substrate-binding protein
MKTSSKVSRRTIVGAAAGVAGMTALGGRAFAQELALPKAPIELNFLDGAGNLIITQPILENYRKAKPHLVSKITYTRAPQPEIASKLKAQQAANRVDIDLCGLGSSGVALGMAEGVYMQLLPTYSNALPKLDDILIDGARKMQAVVQGHGVINGYCPFGPLLEYMPDRVKNPPTTAEDLLAWTRANKNRFMYARPANSGIGIAFMTGLPYILKDANPKDPVKGWDKTWAYLKAIGENVEYYPAGTAALIKEFAEGSRDLIPTLTAFDIYPRVLGTVPKEAKIVAIKGFHWVNEAQYWSVPKGVSNERLAVVLDLMNFMLTREQQAFIWDQGYFYPGPAVKNVPLEMAPAESQKAIKEFGRPEYADLIANNPHETPLDPALIVSAFRRWDEEIGGSKRR